MEEFLQSVEDGREPLRAMVRDLLGRRKTVDDLSDVQVGLEDLARRGTLSIPTQLRRLTDVIWEIKTSRLRLPFYYRNDHLAVPAVRITGGFWKQQARAEQRHIRFAGKVREEDLQNG